MSQRLVSAERPPLRPDLMAEHLLHLSIFKLFVNPSSRSVAIRLNKRFKLRPKIKIKEVDAIYLYLHDIEHDMWLKAKSMNDGEGTQLRQFLSDCGLPPRVWSSVNRLRPVNPTACLRLPTASRTYRVRVSAPRHDKQDENLANQYT